MGASVLGIIFSVFGLVISIFDLFVDTGIQYGSVRFSEVLVVMILLCALSTKLFVYFSREKFN